MGGSSGLENRYVLDGIDITGLTVGNVGTPVLNDFVHTTSFQGDSERRPLRGGGRSLGAGLDSNEQ